MNTLIGDRVSALLDILDQIPYAGRRDLIMNEVIETGGVYLIPQDLPAGGRYLCEIHLHGIRATGGDEADAITNWKDRAADYRRTVAA